MKKIFTKLMLWAVAATALVSCENNFTEESPVLDIMQEVTLTAEKPAEVRTELIEGVPYWSAGDAVGVYLEDNTKHYKFENKAEKASLSATFTGQTAVANTLFVYYPYTANGVADKGAKVDIPANQHPTATSFDGQADIMLAKPVQLDAEGKQISDLEFARLGAIVKIVLKDNTGNLANQHLSAVTMTAATNLVGRVYLDVVNQELGELFYGGSKSVNAEYAEAIAANNPVYLIVYPQTLAAESKLTIEATTEGYAISKEITLPSDIVLESGKVTTLNVSLAAENVVKEETGLALPFEDDFSWVTSTSENSELSAMDAEKYSSKEKVYPAQTAGAVKLGSSSVLGWFKTVELNLSKPFTVFVEAKRYGSDSNSKVQVTVDSQVLTSEVLGADYKYYAFEFDAASKKEVVEFKVTGKRGYINDLKIVEGHGLDLPVSAPVLTVTPSEITGVSHEGETKTFTYSVANPVEGVNATVTDNVDWITTADNNGTVTVTVAANETEEAREGVITVTYGELTEAVNVSQSAKPAEGGDTSGTVTYTVSTTSACTTSGTAPTSSSATYKQTYNTKEQITASNTATFTLSGYAGATIKAITLNMKSNSSKGAGTFSATAGTTTLASISDATNFNKWYDNTSFGASYRDVHVTLINDTYVIKSGEDVVIQLKGTTNSIYIHSVTIDYEIGGNSGTTEPEPATPVLTVTSDKTINVAAESNVETITYSVTNPVDGQSVTASANQTWVSDFDYSVAGEVSFVVETNTGAAREATVTLAYEGAESQTVTISQAAGNTSGGEATTKTAKVTFSSLYSADTDVNGKAIAIDNNVSVTFNKASGSTNPKYYKNGSSVRLYAKGNFVVSSTKTITKITITYGSSDGSNAITASPGTFSSPDWTGSASSVTFTEGGSSGNRRIAAIEVTYQD